MNATRREPHRHGLGDPQVVLADAGYWHQRQIKQAAADGIQILIPPTADCAKAPDPRDGGSYDVMRRVLATPERRTLYRQRQITVEPVFGQIKFKRFQRRARAARRSECKLITATHNLPKLHNHPIAASTPRATTQRPPPAGHDTRH